jgi:hypothetical protein
MLPNENAHIKILNSIFEIEKKITENDTAIKRNVERIKSTFEEIGLRYYNPIGENYTETRTDCEASISGKLTSDMKIITVVKPIIFSLEDNRQSIIQKGVVIVG